MSRHRKSDIYRNARQSSSSSSTLDTIREMCDRVDVRSSTRSGPSTINAIREVCNDFNVQSDTRTSPTSIDAIREICTDFTMQAEPKNSASTIDAIRTVCNSCDRNNSRRVKKTVSKSCGNSTVDDIRELCDGCNNGHCRARIVRDDCYRPYERYDPGVSYFNSVVTPVNGLTPQYSGITGTVQFRMRRKNKTVTLQWEPFSGSISQSGVSFLTVAQTIWNTPPYPVSLPIYIQYKGTNRVTTINIDPHSTNGNIKFYLNTDGSSSDITANDAFYVYAGAISWIVD